MNRFLWLQWAFPLGRTFLVCMYLQPEIWPNALCMIEHPYRTLPVVCYTHLAGYISIDRQCNTRACYVLLYCIIDNDTASFLFYYYFRFTQFMTCYRQNTMFFRNISRVLWFLSANAGTKSGNKNEIDINRHFYVHLT